MPHYCQCRILYGVFGGRRDKSVARMIPVLSVFVASAMVGLYFRLFLHYVVLCEGCVLGLHCR